MISIIIPTHKRTDLLIYEINQIRKQQKVDYEIIVVNDIEEPDSTDIITKLFPDVIYIKSSKYQGPSNKHKIGLKISKGKYIYMPDDDDYLIDELFFLKAIKILESDLSLSFVSGNVVKFFENQNRIIKCPLDISGKIDGLKYLEGFQSRYRKPISTVSTLFRREVLEKQNFLEMREMSDSSMYMNALIGGNAYILDDYVAVYRIRDKSLSTTASIRFIMNVLLQKKEILDKVVGELHSPDKFWLSHVRMTYRLFARSSKAKRTKLALLIWIYRKTDKYKLTKMYLALEYVRCLIFNN